MPEGLLLVVETPHEQVLRMTCDALRVPTETGQVGILPCGEESVLAVEPGLILARHGSRTTLIGTAGGLLHVEARGAMLLSPLAVVGESGGAVRGALEALTRAPSVEMELRRRIDDLERSLLSESRRRAARAGPPREAGR